MNPAYGNLQGNGGAAYRAAMRQYGDTGPLAAARDATPEALVEMLLAGVLQKVAQARQAQRAGDIAGRGRLTGESVALLGYLRGILDHDAGGPLAVSLDALYGHCVHTLLAANLRDDAAAYAEVTALISEVKTAWDTMTSGRSVAA